MIGRKDKENLVHELKRLADSHRSVGILNMEKIPASLVLKAKKELAGKVTVKMGRKTLMTRAIDNSERKGMKDLANQMKGPVAFVFSDSDAFETFRLVKSTRVKAAAKEGDVVTKDIVIPQGPTQIPPGPAISTLQKAGIKARVQGGKLAIMAEKTLLKSGDVVSADAVAALNLLNIMPNEKSLAVSVLWEDGIIYPQSVLDIDMDAFAEEVQVCVRRTISLSLASSFLVRESAFIAVQKAFLEGRSLAIEADILTADTAEIVVGKAVRAARNVESGMKLPAEGHEADAPGEVSGEGGGVEKDATGSG